MPVWGQNPEMAKKYFEQGDLEKASYEYKLLVDKFPYNDGYLFNLIKIYQSQSDFEAVDKLLRQRAGKKKPQYWVYLGYNYQLQKDSIKAQEFYDKAIKVVEKQSFKAYGVGEAFKKLYLLDEALKSYEYALKKSNNVGLYLKIALIYAEKNDLPEMVHNFL